MTYYSINRSLIALHRYGIFASKDCKFDINKQGGEEHHQKLRMSSQLVSGDYNEDTELAVMAMASDLPCFLGHFFSASTSSSNVV